ncbi:MAG: PhzF family phenazine biosynthesis protein [Pseudomonadota bacterium]
MTELNFTQVDVFAGRPQRGNPVAVVHDADALTDEAMAAFARWTNLSETTFLLQPSRAGADYALRIFTPGGELPFAGHPTLGSCHAWLEAGGAPARDDRIVQECGAGLVALDPSTDQLAFAAPPLRRSGPLEEGLVARLRAALALSPEQVLDHAWVDNGPGWCALLLDSAERVLEVRPDLAALDDTALGLVGAWSDTAPLDFEVRAFVPGLGVPEDPVTGSLNAGIAQWLIGSGKAPPNYTAGQGQVLERDGRISVSQRGENIWIAGATETVIRGRVRF